MTSKQKQSNQVRLSFDISINPGQICMGFEADTPERLQQRAHCMRLSDQDLVARQ